MNCRTCSDRRNIYRRPIMWLLWKLFLHNSCGQACAECGTILWGGEPKKELPEKAAARAIKRARFWRTR